MSVLTSLLVGLAGGYVGGLATSGITRVVRKYVFGVAAEVKADAKKVEVDVKKFV